MFLRLFTSIYLWASLVVQIVKNLLAMQGTWVGSLSQEDPLEKGVLVETYSANVL